ncbi:PLC-like phosphodiesterase [Chaetomium tenue]|uniref:PLC-like phosphodiesterase n=1 Tax=Chaetomium tenue TaxID=1854479 RepID=A0ACB7PEY1_9PEZI|nr:PLC-like phosphodiesterase [Chaetomium globosum]
MVPWRTEKPRPAATDEYLSVVGDEETEDGVNGDRIRGGKHKSGIQWTWPTCFFGLILVTVTYLLVRSAEAMAHRFLGVRSSSGDPFVNWGKPGTGTEELAWYPTDFLRDVLPVACHSHNDYWREIPLFTAIYAGCTGVESDVWLRDGDLLVGHDTASLQRNRTFQSLYVNPLVEILTHQNPSTSYYNGKTNGVFDTDPDQPLVLLVDIKTDGSETWPWVMKQLAPLREKGWLSYYENDQFHQRPITVVGTGNAPFDQILGNSSRREAFFDAPLDKLENSGYNLTNSYYASADFWKAIGAVWWTQGPSKSQLEKIRSHIREAKNRGLVSRYWGLPWWPIHARNQVWKVLVDEGIGMLNVDDLEAATKKDWTKRGKF